MLSTRATPAMGWNSWNAFRCYDINEGVILTNADALVRLGLAERGYDTVVVDDGWQAPTRDGDGRLQACPERFPHGMAWLGEQLHRRGLKFGLYLAPGRHTCAQYWDAYGREARWGAAVKPSLPVRAAARSGRLAVADEEAPLGSWGREREDLSQLVSWGIDYLKYDWCRAELGTTYTEPREAFALMGALVAAEEREITYSISEYGQSAPWNWAGEFANSWRTTPDIAVRPRSVFAIARATARHGGASRQGHVGDADILQVGNFPLPARLRARLDRTHLVLWAMLASPLMIGTDLRMLRATDPLVRTLADERAIALNQDPDVRCARLVVDSTIDGGPFDVYERTFGDRTAELVVNTSPRRRRLPAGSPVPGYGSILQWL